MSFISTRNIVAYYWLFVNNALTPEDKRRRDRRIPRIALRPCNESPFSYLLASGNDQALLNVTATDHKVFGDLVSVFEPYFNRYMMDDSGNIRPVEITRAGKPKGRRREIDAKGCLGLVLFWYRTRGSSARGLSMPFGLTKGKCVVLDQDC